MRIYRVSNGLNTMYITASSKEQAEEQYSVLTGTEGYASEYID